MNTKCFICDKEFTTEELLKKHEDEHLNESMLNKSFETPKVDVVRSNNERKIDLKKIFSDEKFEKLIQQKIDSIENTKELIKRRNFVEQIKEINRRNPFCYLPYFVKDFVSGMASTELENKYHIWYWTDFKNIFQNILQFEEKRYLTKYYDDALGLNLKIKNWNEKYQEIQENCEYFKEELIELIFHNMLQSEIILLLMQSNLKKNEILEKCNELKNHYDLFKFMNNDLSELLNQIFDKNLENKINEIILELKKQNIILRTNRNPDELFVEFSIDKIKKFIFKHLKSHHRILYSVLRSKVHEKFPGLRLIPGFGVFGTAWRELEDEKTIHIEYRSSRKNDFVLFLNEDFQKLDLAIKSIDMHQNKIQFKGRKITPDTFISELLELEKGDFDDADDQVTRLAGLVLAESVALQTPLEEIKEFDFSINLKNYRFRQEQLEAMGKLNFQINSEIFHVKVMIDKILDLKKYNNLKEKLPSNEQAVIITFKKIPKNVKSLLEKDPTLQIIDEEGVKIWVSITSRLPARVNSICKISQDPLSQLENKIVKVNSVFYEKGIALVNILPEMNEVTVLARCLEEISLFESKPNDFELYSKNYLEFLNILFLLSSYENVIDGFFKNKFIEEPTKSKNQLEVNFDHNTVNLDLNGYTKQSSLKCDCMQFAENPLHLCSHLISALDYMFRNFLFADKSWPDYNHLKDILDIAMGKNIEIILDRLIVAEENGEIQENSRLSNFVFGINKLKSNF